MAGLLANGGTDIIEGLAEVRRTTTEAIVQEVQTNLVKLIRDDPWLRGGRYAAMTSRVARLEEV
jgi:hypothetical protein